MLGHSNAEGGELALNDRREAVRDPSLCDLAAGRDDRRRAPDKRAYRQQRRAACRLLSLPQLFLSDDERNDTCSGELVARMHRTAAAPRRDHQLVNAVDREEPGAVHEEHALDRAFQLDFSFLCLAPCHVFPAAQRRETLCRVVFVHHARLHLPDEQVFLAHGEQHRDVLLGHNMALAEARSLAHAGNDLRHVMTQHMTDRILGSDTFHMLSTSI